jgi:hypothetical protein
VGNVTPLVSIDGFREHNDLRRGEGVFDAADLGMERLRKNGIIFGNACTVTGKNMDETMSDAYVEHFIRKGAMYIWYYVYRPVGAEPHTEYCMTPAQIVEMRRRMLRLRRKHPIIIIDSYWTAEGEAFCPAAVGLGFHAAAIAWRSWMPARLATASTCPDKKSRKTTGSTVCSRRMSSSAWGHCSKE